MDGIEMIVGIDLGTTFSEISALLGDRPRVLGRGPSKMLPSCVGIAPSGELLVGESARNQMLVYPDATVRSVKRKMGTDETIYLGERTFRPQEISALILRELVQWAEAELGDPVKKAVITVPAYFSDAQRQATREAGMLAGLEVVRILNEPTAAALAYGFDDDARRTVMVYDLGGGTFDVSIVSIEGDVTEVLASHGNNYLGGDDFDQLLLDNLLSEFQGRHGIDLRDCHPASYSRLRWAAEQAKRRLSSEPYASVREENLAVVRGKALHLDTELSRDEYEQMISPLVESTLESVSKAMDDAGKRPGDIDDILLVGGSTRTPLIWRVLEERVGITPRQDIHPDLCVALGSGLLASRLAGHDIERVLVDVSPYSFGPSFLGELDGRMYPHCYKPVIRRNTPLPVTRTESYYTAVPYQKEVEVEIFQGDNYDALKNIPVGSFRIEGLTATPEQNEVMCRISLDLDGILKVTAIEKRTGKSKYITISNALKPKNEQELALARQRLNELCALRGEDLQYAFDEDIEIDPDSKEPAIVEGRVIESEDELEQCDAELPTTQEPEEAFASKRIFLDARDLVTRSRDLLHDVHDEDKEDIINLHEKIEKALADSDLNELGAAVGELKELLFFIEGE